MGVEISGRTEHKCTVETLLHRLGASEEQRGRVRAVCKKGATGSAGEGVGRTRDLRRLSCVTGSPSS